MTASEAPVTLCIINYNGAHYLEAALKAAASQAYRFAEILVVDNASTDGSAALIRQHCADVRLLVLPENKGPGAARNAGIAAAANDLILFQDNDVRLDPDCPEQLLFVLAQRPAATIAVPRVLYERDPQVIQYEGADCHVLGMMMPRHADCPAAAVSPAIARATSLITCCFLMHRARCGAMDFFDEDFVFNLEDHDFGVRSSLLGHEIWVNSIASVRHGGGSAGLSYRPGYDVSSRRMLFLIRNRWFVIAKAYRLRSLLLLLPLLLFYELATLAGAVKKGYAREWWAAVLQLVHHWPALCTKRARVQDTRRIADRQILRNGPLPFTAAMRSSRGERFAVALIGGIVTAYWKCVKRFI
jgi:GT2 family glycosyltransferase